MTIRIRGRNSAWVDSSHGSASVREAGGRGTVGPVMPADGARRRIAGARAAVRHGRSGGRGTTGAATAR